jgi:ppGpp synthetase/RelA/SpoT-type nucleotidyltranferase
MRLPQLSGKIINQIEGMVALYSGRREEFANLAQRVERDLVEHAKLRPLIHSTKRREKDPSHLRDKLERKANEALRAGKRFAITEKNMFDSIGDLAGVRLHIHTEQLSVIHPTIMEILAFHKYHFREDPLVFIWDVERNEFFKKLGLNVQIRPTMYTSVHYVVEPHWRGVACEIQVRTLAEELWGEVSHQINYPNETDSIACTEQLAALARVASGCTRLVDSIFASMSEHSGKRPCK